MPYSGPAYWEVIYKAIADFGDVITEAAKARAALDALSKSAKDEGAVEKEAADKAAAAHKLDTTAINNERRALEELGVAAKRAQQWTEWGGRTDPGAHIADLARTLEYKRLINIQDWLTFTSPQAAYAWRERERLQAVQMNYALWGGYTTPDQYLGYLQRQRTDLAGLNAVLIDRVSVYKENTDAALAYANALRGTHGSVSQLGSGLDLSGISQFNASLTALPDTVTTTLELDDSAALAELARYEALLHAVPHAETTVLTSSQVRGAAPVTGSPGPEVVPVSFGGPYQEQFAAIMAEVARLNGLRAEIPVHFDLPAASEVSQFVSHIPVAGVTEPVRLVSQGGGAGGGGGPPPAAPAPGADEPPDDAAAKWAALAAAQKTAAGAADADAIKFKAAAAALDTLGGAARRIRGWWGLLAHDFTLFAGLFGSAALIGTIAGWHIALDGIIEILALLIPAVVTATAGLLGWGAAAAESGQKVYNQMKNVLTVSSALDTVVPPLKGHFEDLQNAVRPQVFQLFGDALDLLNGKTGIFQDLIMQTGHALDYFGARIVVDLQQGGSGLQKFFDAGTKILGLFGQIFVNLGHALSGFLKATEITHIAEDLLTVAAVLSKLLTIVAALPVPLLALGIGLHGAAVWGGLAVTVLSKMAIQLVSLFSAIGPLNGVLATLAGKLGASDAQLIKMAGHAPAVKQVADALGQNSASVAQFAVAADKSGKSVTQLALETSNGAAMLDKYGKGLSSAGQDAVALAVAAGGTEAQIAKVASGAERAAVSTGFFASALGKVGGVAGLATGGLIALAGAAAVFAYKSLTARDASQQWIDSVNKGLASQSLFTVIGKNMADLASVTDRLSHSQGLNAQSVHELSGAQSELSGNLALALPRVGQVSRAYGVDMVGALELLNLAGVKSNDLFTKQGLVWATDEQMVKGLIDGYKAMGQQLGTVGSDLNVLLVSESDQLKSMTSLNKAWDSFQKIVSGSTDNVIKVAQDLQGFAKDAGQAGASMTGLGANALLLQKDFQGTYGDVQSLFDAFRSAQATDGGAGNFTKFVKDAVAALIPLAGQNKAAAAEISQLAQEAGGPATTNLQQLARWTGNVKDPMLALYNAAHQATIASSDLSADAARLSNTLQSDLNPAMAKAAFDAEGGQKALSAFADDLLRLGPGSQATIAAGRQVADMFLSIDKNSGQAKAQFVGWAESMGLSAQQANALWAKVSAGARPLTDMRQGLATSATASDNLAKSGFFAQRGDTFRTNMQAMANWFTDTLPHAIKTSAGAVAGFFTKDLGPPVAGFFTKTIPAAAGSVAGFFSGPFRTNVEGAWSHVWSALVSPVVHAFDLVKGAITSGFDGWWKSHGMEVEQVWASVTGNLSLWWRNFTGGLETAWKTFTGWFSGAGDLRKTMAPVLDGLVGAFKVVIGTIEGIFRVAWGVIGLGAKVAWDLVAATAKTAFDAIAMVFKTMWDAAMLVLKVAWAAAIAVVKIAWDVFIGVINVALDLLTGHWGKAWTDMKAAAEQVWNALKAFFETTWKDSLAFLTQLWNNFDTFFHQMWNNALTFLRQAWNAFWSWFSGTIIANFAHFFTRTIPSWWSGFLTEARNTWSSVWGAFDRTIIANFTHFFTRTVPSWWSSFVRGGENAMGQVATSVRAGFKNAVNFVITNVINRAIGFINDVTSIVGIPKIRGVATLAAGGAVRMAAGSVPGTGDEDGTHIIAMGGEYMLRKPARMALEAVMGRGFMDHLNQADTWLSAGSRGNAATQRRAAGGGIQASPVMASGGFVNPIGGGLRPERVDMGVDYGGSGALYALGAGTITSLFNRGWPGGGFVGLHLASAPVPGGNYWYYAEDVNPVGIGVGSAVHAGQRIASATGGSSGIEVGFAAPPGTGSTMAAVTGEAAKSGDPGSHPTGWGEAASNLIASLGGPRGITSGKVVGGTPGVGGGFGAIWQTVEGLLNAVGTGLSGALSKLAGFVKGGAGELLKLAKLGGKAVFDAVWSHTIQPLINNVIPGGDASAPGAVLDYAGASIKKGLDTLFGAKDAAAQQQAAAMPPVLGPAGPASASVSQAKAYAASRLGAHGWGQDQMKFLDQLWTRESGWNRLARNPSSGAYGIPQALPGSKMGAAANPPTSSAGAQINWGEGYIKGTYGTPQNAWSHELSFGWYPHGGVVGGDDDAASAMATGGTLPAWAGPLNTAVVSDESPAFWKLMAGKLPGTATAAQRSTFAAWSRALEAQQLKTFGLGRKPPGAYDVLSREFGNTSAMTAGQWSAFTGGLGTLVREEEGTGIAGGMNPPGTPANSGYVAWHYLRPQWQRLLTATRLVQSRAAAAHAAWATGAVPNTGGAATPVGLVPEWEDALHPLTGAIGTLRTAVVSDESPAFWKLMGEKLPARATRAQRTALAAWDRVLTAQQYKTIGLGHSPPGAYAKLDAHFTSPAAITASEWSAFSSDLNRLVAEEAGTGIKGGINPPGTPADSGHVPWQYFRAQWQTLRNSLLKVQERIPLAQRVWQNVYGPAHLPYTPGPGKPPAATGMGGLPDLEPFATMGGPAMPVLPGSGTPDTGFAAGGGLGDVSSMFSGSLSPGGTMLPLVVRFGVPDTLMRQLGGGSAAGRPEYPRKLSEAGASHYGPALNVEQLNINNPLPQRPSDSIAHAANRMAFLAGRGVN